MISKGFGFVAFFASVKVSSVCIKNYVIKINKVKNFTTTVAQIVSNKSPDVHIKSGQTSKMTSCLADLFYQKHPEKHKKIKT